MTCEICKGRGWLPDRVRTAVKCPLCGGRADISWGAVARKLNEDPGNARSRAAGS